MEALTKNELRTTLKQMYSEVTQEALDSAASTIWMRVLTELSQLPALTSVHIYQANKDWNELPTDTFKVQLTNTFSVKVDQPKASSSAPFPNTKYDVIIVPCLGFDSYCNRLGRGAGWYDKFLSIQPHALKIGVALEAAHCSSIPVESHDQTLDMIITEMSLYQASHGKVS